MGLSKIKLYLLQDGCNLMDSRAIGRAPELRSYGENGAPCNPKTPGGVDMILGRFSVLSIACLGKPSPLTDRRLLSGGPWPGAYRGWRGKEIFAFHIGGLNTGFRAVLRAQQNLQPPYKDMPGLFQRSYSIFSRMAVDKTMACLGRDVTTWTSAWLMAGPSP